ncbi:uncharacterized protein TNCV_1603991 [Trichonephila clavipes]|nr:uncharacterized protein TNCV_1603991 [Trichonephila clavipes]
MMSFRYVSWFKTCSTFSLYRYPPRITTQTKPGLLTEHHIGPLSHTTMLMFQTPVQTSTFMRLREGNANCRSSGIHASMIVSPVNSLSRNSYSCGDCERRIQCSGSTAPLTSRTYYQISVLVRGCDSCGRPGYWLSGNISHSLKPLPVLKSQTGPHSEFRHFDL